MTDRVHKQARQLRTRQTKAESLLWNVLRAKRLSGLKFRRQHPIKPFIADFACTGRKIVIEIDGGYQYEDDLGRQRYIEEKGWHVIRFSNEDVLDDVEAVAIAIVKRLDLQMSFAKRQPARSGMLINKKPSPGPESPTSPTSERGGDSDP